jgi:hypothetical protein
MEAQPKSLEVLSVKKQKEPPSDLNPILLPHAFLMCLVAPPRAGKSNLIMNLICNSEFYRGKKKDHYFDEIYFLSPTSVFDKTTAKALSLMDNCIQISDPYELLHCDIFLQQLQAEQASMPIEERKRILVVFDDMVQYLKTNKEIGLLACKYRHYGLSIICVAQSYRAIPLLMRNCATAIITFNLHNPNEVRKMVEEYLGGFPDGEMLYNHATEKKYNFLYADIEHQKLYHNFNIPALYCKDRDTPE